MADSTSTVQLMENRYTPLNFFHLEAMKMAETRKKNFNSPEETRDVDKGKVEVLNVGGVQVMRATFQPGWKWSECVKPIVGDRKSTRLNSSHVALSRMPS